MTEPPALENIDGERKMVTALFADIKGSMELMEDLDPEEARAIIDPALRIMIDAVRRYDGYVVQSIGDGIFALFGAPLAHEDHPQRALYAALRTQDEMRRYSTKLRGAGKPPIEARVGVNTGEVVVRTLKTGDGHTEYTPIGHTANLASRMQTLAPTGSIAVSENTRRLVEGYFVLKPLGPTKVKGLSEPTNVYEVTGIGPLRTRLQRAVGRGLTKFVGREHEMEALKHAAELARQGHGQIVAAMAEPGVGKSRLYFEFKAISQSGWMVLETFSISHGKASAYLPVLDLLHGYFKIASADDERTRREKVAGRLAMLDPTLEDTRPYLFSLLGIIEGADPLAQMDGQLKKRRTLEAIKRILLRESMNQPLMVIFEDLHWIDEATQEFVNLLADSIATAKILLLVNYRPEYSHQWNSKTYYIQLRLDPLGEQSADEMLTALLGDGKDLLPLRRLIIERTEGNPFFIEEIVQVLLDEGTLMRDGAGVRVTKPLNALTIPPTVQGILSARMDRLPADAKELLQTLAVTGREFSLSLIQAVVAKSHEELNRLLDELQLGEFIYEQPATGGIEYIFKHALTQEVAYNSVLVERRRQLHERIAAALEELHAGSIDEHLAELAHHYVRGTNLDKAVEYLTRAGRQAQQRSAYREAIENFVSAIDLVRKLPDGPERNRRELRLQLALGPALVGVRWWSAPEVERAFTRARKLSEQLDEPSALFRALFGLSMVYQLRGELRLASELAAQLMQLAESAHDSALFLLGRIALGETLLLMGEPLRAREQFEEAIMLYGDLADPRRHRRLPYRSVTSDGGVSVLSGLSSTLWVLGYPDQALKRSNEAVAVAKALSHPNSLVFAETHAGLLRQRRREAGAAQLIAESSIALSAEQGLTNWCARATTLRGWAMAEQGRNDEGIAQLQEGLAAYRATGGELWWPYNLVLLAEAYMRTGRPDHGMSAVTEALAAAEEHEDRHHEAEMHRLEGDLLLRLDGRNAAEAQNCFRRAIEIARKQSAKSWELRASMSLARLLARQGRRDEARTMLAEIYNWFTEGFDTADLKDGKALLDELST
jgi:class 3 adenylate cyclase/predicted ATPase